MKPLVCGDTLYVLEEDKILLQREECVNYHKREYDYETYQSFKLKDANTASLLFREMQNMWKSGYQAGSYRTKHDLEESIKNIFKEF